ncbi:hypothetical protein BBP13_12285 [Limosilactobacillus reuteri]|nr:hypothetical protein BBP13_12285 [Limosilactobacillus reuteri]
MVCCEKSRDDKKKRGGGRGGWRADPKEATKTPKKKRHPHMLAGVQELCGLVVMYITNKIYCDNKKNIKRRGALEKKKKK